MFKLRKCKDAVCRYFTIFKVIIVSVTIVSAGSAHAIVNTPVVSGKALTRDATPTWKWASGSGGNGQYRYKLDNNNLSTGATETVLTTFTSASPLAEGKHILYVQEKNDAGTWSTSGKRAVTIDITPPNPPTVSGKTPTRDTTPSWTWVPGGDGNGTFRYKLDNSNMTSGATMGISTAYTPLAPLTEGKHTLYVQERDAAGNWSDLGKKAIIVDLTPPEAPVVEGASPTTDATPAWSWTSGDDGGAYRYKLDDSNLKTGATITTMLNFTPGNPLSEGEHILYVQKRDKAGNWSVAGSRAIQIETPSAMAVTLPDTGQIKCYNLSSEISCPTPGKAFHGQDANYTINPPNYTVHDNSTVTDNVTGLMWQRKDDNISRTWNQAMAYCEALSLAGFSDWHLPSKKELVGIVNFSKPSCGPAINTVVFPNTNSSYYWSSTKNVHYVDHFWGVDFCVGYLSDYQKESFLYARCVRERE